MWSVLKKKGRLRWEELAEKWELPEPVLMYKVAVKDNAQMVGHKYVKYLLNALGYIRHAHKTQSILRCRIITVIKLQSKNLRLQADYSVVHLNSFRFIWAPVFIVCTALFLSEVTVHCSLHGFLDTHLLIHSWCDIARNRRVGAVIGRRRWFCGRINADEKKSMFALLCRTHRNSARSPVSPSWTLRISAPVCRYNCVYCWREIKPRHVG